MDKKTFVQTMDRHPEYQQDLFIRGFLITDRLLENTDHFPFYGNWKTVLSGKYYLMAHKLTGLHTYTDETGATFFIMGHAYNPCTLEPKEENILKYIAESHGTEDYFVRISELTGIFVLGRIMQDEISFLTDPSGMQSACYGKIGEHFYLSSHPQLIGDLCELQMDAFVKELIQYKWYGRVMGPYLPADLTPFSEVKRIVPDIFYSYQGAVSYQRFWPLNAIKPVLEKAAYDAVIEEAATILKNNFTCIVKKWEHPWISLTGGIDSNTTFAAANGCHDRIETFSYISAEKEIPDAAAAKKIADHFKVTHHEFQIPAENGELKDYDLIREILNHNNGYIANRKENETRKRIYLRQNATCDVEVKSWASETIRAYWYKHYGRRRMPKLSAKLYRNLYKIFITNRKLAHQIDRLFDQYIKQFEYDKIPDCYPPADIHYNEVTWGSWGGLNISEMKYCFDITIPYNNRKFMGLLFRVPLEKRISDQHHLDMKKVLNRELYDMNIRVVNLKETNFRAFALNVIFTLNSILPF